MTLFSWRMLLSSASSSSILVKRYLSTTASRAVAHTFRRSEQLWQSSTA
eukprot:CAMPEP_0204114474 /NCGR_PEP_ID=MMETSP0361-20130328/4282_1 /ASSEMBLY_ACC=CAM_ASM_000343 /TAXON_ID=268821 /ORGANISM="Scrippsiella Hangoei, Strain SHTV-5" /LENGTH=48 /DNA_ID= /DNA_START= /DNA_END= /DNA_ORIENTATION=